MYSTKEEVKMQIKPITFSEVNREYFLGDMSEVFLKINKILKEEWRGIALEINEIDLNLNFRWSNDGYAIEVVKAYIDAGWNVTAKEDEDNYLTLLFKEQ